MTALHQISIFSFLKNVCWTSLVVQWLKLQRQGKRHGSLLDWGTKFLTPCGMAKRLKKKKSAAVLTYKHRAGIMLYGIS